MSISHAPWQRPVSCVSAETRIPEAPRSRPLMTCLARPTWGVLEIWLPYGWQAGERERHRGEQSHHLRMSVWSSVEGGIRLI